MDTKKFGMLPDGQEVTLYTLKNSNGMEVQVTDLGAVLVALKVPDKDGNAVDVVLGYETFEQYIQNKCFFGATIGRSGNRIGGASLVIDGKEYKLAANDNGLHNLHSGPDGYEKRMWEAEAEDTEEGESITFYITSPDGDQGYPGNLDVEVTYTLTEENELMIDYWGVSDADTIMNMTNHSYFNLNGEGSGDILGHRLTLVTDGYTETDEVLIPTGNTLDVAGTPMDFTEPKEIGRDIKADFAPLKYGHGYDHNFVVNGGEVQDDAEFIARVEADKTGIVMEVYTDMPAVQFYTASTTNEPHGKQGHAYGNYSAFCLETQYIPDAVHHENFASPLLAAEEERASLTVYRFMVKDEE